MKEIEIKLKKIRNATLMSQLRMFISWVVVGWSLAYSIIFFPPNLRALDRYFRSMHLSSHRLLLLGKFLSFSYELHPCSCCCLSRSFAWANSPRLLRKYGLNLSWRWLFGMNVRLDLCRFSINLWSHKTWLLIACNARRVKIISAQPFYEPHMYALLCLTHD